MAVNPLERVRQVAGKLAQAKVGRRGLLVGTAVGTAGGALGLALDRVRPAFADDTPRFLRITSESPVLQEERLEAGEMLVLATREVTVAGNTYRVVRPNEALVVVARTKLDENRFRLPLKFTTRSADGRTEQTGTVEFNEQLDDIYRTGHEEALRLIAEATRANRPLNRIRFVGMIGHQDDLGDVHWDDVASNLTEKRQSWWLDSEGNWYVDRVDVVAPVLPKPPVPVTQPAAPRAEAPATRAEVRVLGFPTTREEAASAFGKDEFSKDPNRWELSADGGWHFKEGPVASSVDPKGFVLEGYRDTKPGKNADAFVSNGVEISMQGGTIWPVRGEGDARKLLAKMSPVTWDDGAVHPPRPIGFSR